MTADPSSVRLAGARPVADAPVQALVDRADELARRWASALVAARPLAEMTAVPLEDLAREAPGLCARLARALGSDGELEQLLAPAAAGERGAAAPRPAALAAWLAPANDASSAVRDIEVLRGVVWEAALGELREPAVAQVAELSDRLAFVCAALLAALLDRHELAGEVLTPSATAASTAASSRERVLYRSPPSSPGGRRATLIDERDETVRSPARERDRDATGAGRIAAPAYAPARSPREPAPQQRQSSTPARAAPRARPWDTPLDGAGQTADGARDRAPQSAVPDGAGAEMRVTRGPGATADERA
jgi:hypothetical protein